MLSHCGYEKDIEIAKKSKFKISVIVGGHTDTFLYTGSNKTIYFCVFPIIKISFKVKVQDQTSL